MHFDIFNDDAFSLSALTATFNEREHVPGRLGQLGMFDERGIPTTSVSIESVGQEVKLVPNTPRGAPAEPNAKQKRALRQFKCSHLPQVDAVYPDEIQNVRAFGSETEVQTAQAIVNEKLDVMRTNIEVTLEWQRMGAIKGQILDADGTTVLLDLFSEFGVTQQTKDMGLDSDTTNVKIMCTELQRMIEGALGGVPYRGIRVFCSEEFFDDFVGHPAVERAYDRWMNGEFLREQQRDENGGGGFYFGGIYWEEYRGRVGSTRFIAEGDAYAVPLNVPRLLISRFGPADYMETVNTMGVPVYAKQWMAPGNKYLHLEGQSNPIHLCTRPRSIVRLTAA